MFPVALEPRCRSEEQWQPIFIGKLGGKPLHDLSMNFADEDSAQCDEAVDRLAAAIRQQRTSGPEAAGCAAEIAGASIREDEPLSHDKDKDEQVGEAALSLLHVLSGADSLRGAIQATEPLGALLYLYEEKPKHRKSVMLLVANMYAEGLEAHGDGDSDDMKARNTRIRELLSSSNIAETVVDELNNSLQAVLCGNGPRELRAALATVRSLATDGPLRELLVQGGVTAGLVNTLNEAGECPDGATAATLAVAAEALHRCAFTKDLRPRLIEDGAERALRAKAESGAGCEDEGELRLQQAAAEALAALEGRVDKTGTELWRAEGRLSQNELLRKGRTTWTEPELLALPHFNVFLSHKRSSAQDFARGLHSLIVSKGYSCFLGGCPPLFGPVACDVSSHVLQATPVCALPRVQMWKTWRT